jgi:hypothetical protein
LRSQLDRQLMDCCFSWAAFCGDVCEFCHPSPISLSGIVTLF